MFGRCLRVLFNAVVVCSGLTTAVSGQQVGRTPMDAEALHAPAVVTSLGRSHLVYELHLTNFGQDALTLERLDVLDQDALLATLTRSQLAQRVTVIGRPDISPGAALPPGARGVAYLWVSLAPGARVPDALTHRLIVSTGDGHSGTIVLAPVSVQNRAASVESPVEGGPWVAVRGPSNSSPHRLSIIAVNGRAHIPQRFAVDWARLGENGLLFRGDGARLEDWYGYDAPVLAAAAGIVVLVRDGVPDREPLKVTAPATIDATDAPGNVVVIEIGDGMFAAYAHLRAGTIRVVKGDRVSPGQLLGHVGNSGNTLGPHLHFQVADAIEPLAGEGLPFVLRAFTLSGRVASAPALIAGTPWRPNDAQPARGVSGELPLENMVMQFGTASVAATPPR